MFELPNVQPRDERRKNPRITLPRGLMARLGTYGIVLIDTSEGGARIEHFSRHTVGRKAPLRFDWEKKSIEGQAVVVWSKIHRFVHGDDGTTVYQSGLYIPEYVGDSGSAIHQMVTTFIARSLAEQVANARGIGPVTQSSMPVFRGGAVVGTADRGYVRCTLIDNRRWDKKWSRTTDQPVDGFTVPATEPDETIDQLCVTYQRADAEGRNLIRLMARLSVEKAADTEH